MRTTDTSPDPAVRPAFHTCALGIAHPSYGPRSGQVAVVISADAVTRSRWRHGLTYRGVSPVLECSSAREVGSMLGTLGPQGVLVILDLTMADTTTWSVGPASPSDPSREDRLVILGPPEPVAALVGLMSGARAVLFQRRRTLVDHDATTTAYPGADNRATGELGGFPVTAADGTATWLTWREVEVLRHVADGLTNKEIGELLGLSTLTVKSHLARASRRLQAQDRSHLVLLALRAKAIT